MFIHFSWCNLHRFHRCLPDPTKTDRGASALAQDVAQNRRQLSGPAVDSAKFWGFNKLILLRCTKNRFIFGSIFLDPFLVNHSPLTIIDKTKTSTNIKKAWGFAENLELTAFSFFFHQVRKSSELPNVSTAFNSMVLFMDQMGPQGSDFTLKG